MAVPYSSVRTGNTYVTSGNDLVIDSTRLPTLNNILSPNVSDTVPADGRHIRPQSARHLSRDTVAGGARSMMVSRITSEFNGLKTTITSADIDSRYTFVGQAGWADCTYGPGGIGSPSLRPYSICGYDAWLAPIVQFYTPGPTATPLTTRLGAPSEVNALATAQVNACIAIGATHWNTLATTGTVAGQTFNCSAWASYSSELAWRYNGYRSGDSTTTTTVTWLNPYGIPPTLYGNTTIYKKPICRN